MADINRSASQPSGIKPVEPTKSPKRSPKTADKSSVKRSKWPMLIVFTALLLGLASIILGGVVWTRLNHQLALAAQARVELSKRIENLNPTPVLEKFTKIFLAEVTDLKTQLENQQRQQVALREAVVQAHDLASRSQRGWIIAEVKYLVELAQHKLQLMRDIDGAIAALRSADQRLKVLFDPSFAPILKVISADIEVLKSFPRPDLVAISLKLNRIITQHWPMLVEKPKTQPSQLVNIASVSKKHEDQTHGQESVLVALLTEINKHLVIRRHDQPLQPLPEAQIQLFHYQLLRLKLEAARLAVVTENNAEYQRQLQSALDWISAHYSTANAKVLIDELESLKAIQIRPDLPNVNRSLSALSQLKGNQRSNEEDT